MHGERSNNKAFQIDSQQFHNYVVTLVQELNQIDATHTSQHFQNYVLTLVHH